MAGDNAAINAGLALIKLIQAILELSMKVMDHKDKNLQNEINNLKKDNETNKGKIDKLEKQQENIGKFRNNVNKIINEPGNATIINAINNAKGNNGTLTNNDILKISESILNKAAEGIDIPEDERKSLLGSIENAVRKTMPWEATNEIHDGLKKIDSAHPFAFSTINVYINNNLNSNDPKLQQNAKVLQDVVKDNRQITFGGKTYDTSQNKSKTGMTFGSPGDNTK